MAYLLFDDATYFDLRPFTFTRPAYELRSGILTCRERWANFLGERPYTLAYGYLGEKYTHLPPAGQAVLALNGRFVPDSNWQALLTEADPGCYYQNEAGELLLATLDPAKLDPAAAGLLTVEQCEALGLRAQTVGFATLALAQLPDLFRLNAQLIQRDLPLVASGPSQKLADPHTRVYGADNLYLAPGVRVKAAILNAEDGPIYLGPGVNVQEGAIIHSTHALLDHATVNMGAKLRGDTTVGPWSKVGGEVANSVIMGYSNKGHEGYLGNSVLGYWCNLGADTNTSNLKNTYANIRIWHEPSQRFRDTGLQFCGLLMGDHSKAGINTMFNTGTVVGVSANVFGAGYPRTFIPSFAWGGAGGLRTYRLKEAFEVAERVMSRRGIAFDATEQALLQAVFDETAASRHGQ
jgi:UDP-N-acetylglucosamine diphosphorylase/glucosamine-1-phosphate N-acetyltransferase